MLCSRPCGWRKKRIHLHDFMLNVHSRLQVRYSCSSLFSEYKVVKNRNISFANWVVSAIKLILVELVNLNYYVICIFIIKLSKDLHDIFNYIYSFAAIKVLNDSIMQPVHFPMDSLLLGSLKLQLRILRITSILPRSIMPTLL